MRLTLLSVAALATMAAVLPASAAAAATKRDGTPAAPQHSGTSPSSHSRATVVRKRDGSLQLPVVSPEADVSPILCPLDMTVCPLSRQIPTALEQWIEEGFECVDSREDLTSCGGCGSVDTQYDCTAIPHAVGVSCEVGTCRVHSCMSGYALALDGKSCVALALPFHGQPFQAHKTDV